MPRRLHGGGDGGHHDVVAGNPERLRPTSDDGIDGLDHCGRAVDVRLEQRNSQRATRLARGRQERARVRLRRIPCRAHDPEAGQRLLDEPEHVVDWQERALAHHVLRVLHRVGAVEADPGDEGIRHDAEDVTHAPFPVGVGDGLHRRRTRREDEVVIAVHDLTGNGVADRHVCLGVEPLYRRRGTIREPVLGQPLDHACDSVIEDGTGSVLQDGDLDDRPWGRGPAAEVRKKQDGGRQEDQSDAERKTLECKPHVAARGPILMPSINDVNLLWRDGTLERMRSRFLERDEHVAWDGQHCFSWATRESRARHGPGGRLCPISPGCAPAGTPAKSPPLKSTSCVP